MPTRPKVWWQRSVLRYGCAVAACGFAVLATARAQSLDMDGGAGTAPVATHQSGGLDMDVNPTAAGAAAGALPAARPVAGPGAPKSSIQTVSSGANVQDGIVQVNPTAPSAANVQDGIVQVNPNAMPAQTTAPAPATTPATTAVQAPPAAATGTQTAPSLFAPASTPPMQTPLTQPLDGSASTTSGLPAAEPISLDHPTVVDTARLKSGGTSVTLFGIDGVQGEAAQNLQSFLASTGNHLTCQAQTGADFVCLLSDGTDVAQAALINGAARVKDDAPDAYREQEAAAQAARRGIWASLPPPPATVAHPTVQDTATLVADNQTYVLDGLRGLGAPYAAQMQSYIAANGDSVSCSPQETAGHYICVLGDGTDIAKVALVNGGAMVGPGAPDAYRVEQLEALNNHRGIWVSPPPNLLTASVDVVQPMEFALVAGDDGSDGITYVGGVPEAMIDGSAVFLIYGGDAGWGYYDGGHHWRSAPDRYRAHMERYHPDGHGLRGYHDVAGRGGVRPGEGRAGEGRAGEVHTAALAGHPGGVAPGAHPGVVGGGGVHPGVASGAPGVHPGVAPGGYHPGVGGAPGGHSLVAPGAHPGMASGGFVHPGPSAGGFHPGGGAPAMHASSGGGAVRKH